MKALIIVDMQRGFIPEHAKGLDKAIAEYAKTFGHIAIFKYINTEYTGCTRVLGWHDMQEGSKDIVLCTAIQDILSWKTDVKLFNKTTYTCVNDDLIQWLITNNIKEIEVVGVSLTCCVLVTAYGLLDKGFDVSIVSDLCTASTLERYEAAKVVIQDNVKIKTSLKED